MTVSLVSGARRDSQPPTFGSLLRSLREAAGYSQNALAHGAFIDPAYVNRLERSPGQPSRAVVLALWASLGACFDDRERLLVAAGLCPETIVKAGGWDAYRASCDAAISWAVAGNVAVLTRKLELASIEVRRQATLIVTLRRSLGGDFEGHSAATLVRLPDVSLEGT